MTKSKILGVVLAGGLSRRMEGGKKFLKKIDNTPIIDLVIKKVTNQVDELIINANENKNSYLKKFNVPIVPDIIKGFKGPLVGILSAMMGVGGGFIMIPAMVYILGMSTSVVVGTSLFQIIFVTANSTFFQSYLNQNVDIVLAALMIFGGVIGAQIGAKLGTSIKAEYLRGALGFIVLTVCLKILLDLTLTPNELFSLGN